MRLSEKVDSWSGLVLMHFRLSCIIMASRRLTFGSNLLKASSSINVRWPTGSHNQRSMGKVLKLYQPLDCLEYESFAEFDSHNSNSVFISLANESKESRASNPTHPLSSSP